MVDIMTITQLEANVSKLWDYDMVVFGTWDRAGACAEYIQTKNFPNQKLIDELNKYLDARYSVVASHDTISHFSGNAYGLGLIKDPKERAMLFLGSHRFCQLKISSCIYIDLKVLPLGIEVDRSSKSDIGFLRFANISNQCSRRHNYLGL